MELTCIRIKREGGRRDVTVASNHASKVRPTINRGRGSQPRCLKGEEKETCPRRVLSAGRPSCREREASGGKSGYTRIGKGILLSKSGGLGKDLGTTTKMKKPNQGGGTPSRTSDKEGLYERAKVRVEAHSITLRICKKGKRSVHEKKWEKKPVHPPEGFKRCRIEVGGDLSLQIETTEGDDSDHPFL